MEKLIKSALGQWSIISSAISSALQEDMTILSKADNVSPIDKSHNEKTSKMFEALSASLKGNSVEEKAAAKGELKNHLLTAPKGSIDIGHLGKLRDEHGHSNTSNNSTHYKTKFNSEDMADVINRHVGDKTRSLKSFHDTHGDAGLRTLMDTMGANGVPQGYSNLKLHPRLHADLLDLVNPGKAEHDRVENRHKGVLPFPPWHKTQKDVLGEGGNGAEEVDNTYEAMNGWNLPEDHPDLGEYNPEQADLHSKAVIDRGLHIFKNHYKTK